MSASKSKVLERFKIYYSRRHHDGIDTVKVRWSKFIDESLKNNFSIIPLEITREFLRGESELSCSGWDFSKVDVVITGNHESIQFMDFSSCIFKSLTIDGVTCDIDLSNSEILEDATINVTAGGGRGCDLNGMRFFSQDSIIRVKLDCDNYEVKNLEFGKKGERLKKIEVHFSSVANKSVNFINNKFYSEECEFHFENVKSSFSENIFSQESKLSFVGKNGGAESCDFGDHIFKSQKEVNFKDIKSVKLQEIVECKSVNIKGNIDYLRIKKVRACTFKRDDAKKDYAVAIRIYSSSILGSSFQGGVKVGGLESNKGIVLISGSFFKGELKNIKEGDHLKIDNCEVEILNTNSFAEIKNSKKINSLHASGKVSIINSTVANIEAYNSLESLNIEGSSIVKCSFYGCRFRSKAIFSDVTFVSAPEIYDIEFTSHNVEFNNVKFDDTNKISALGSYRALVSACNKAGYEHGVIFFHALELETYYNTHLKDLKCSARDWPEKLGSYIHKFSTDYGTNLIRPIIILCIIFLIGCIVNILCSLTNEILPCSLVKDSLLISFKNTLGPLVFALPSRVRGLEVSTGSSIANIAVNLYSFIQISACSILWFLTGFMIRRRFKV